MTEDERFAEVAETFYRALRLAVFDVMVAFFTVLCGLSVLSGFLLAFCISVDIQKFWAIPIGIPIYLLILKLARRSLK